MDSQAQHIDEMPVPKATVPPSSSEPIDFGEIELITVNESKLGKSTQSAAPNTPVGEIDIGKASVTGNIGEFAYSSTLPLCYIPLTLSIVSTKSCRIEELKFTCTVNSPSTEKIKSASPDIVHPKFVFWAPQRLEDENKTVVKRMTHKVLEPNFDFSALGGPALSFGSIGRDEVYDIKSGWGLNSDWKTEVLPHDTVWYSAHANDYQTEGLNHDFEIEVLIEHLRAPFYIDFCIKVMKLNFSKTHRRWLKRSVEVRKNFLPTS